jgi:hypothetical protein
VHNVRYFLPLDGPDGQQALPVRGQRPLQITIKEEEIQVDTAVVRLPVAIVVRVGRHGDETIRDGEMKR